MHRGSGRWFSILTVICVLVLIVESKKKGRHPAFEKLVNQMWDLDENRFELNKDLILDMQTHVNELNEDVATRPLFVFVNETRLHSTPTYRAFIHLMKFYDPNLLKEESSSPQKTESQMKFLDAVVETKVMKTVQRYLVEKELAPSDELEFKDFLSNMWFATFLRKKRRSSSPFEHVFFGEGRGTRAMGFHYWLPLYLHEQHQVLDYHGLQDRRSGGLKNLLSVAFRWHNDWMKDYGTFIFGTSPEFEMGLYTAAFLTMKSIWPTGFRYALSIKLKNTRLSIQCYRSQQSSLGSCFIV